MLDLLPWVKARFFDSNGIPLAGGQLFSYVAGTTTPLATYTDSSGLTANTNPIILDANGQCNAWVNTGTFKFVLEDSLGNVQWTVDNWQALNTRIAAQINLAGALAVVSNLSDVASATASVKNLGIAPYTYPTKFSVLSGQSATNLTGESFDGTVYTSVVYAFEVVQGTTIMASGDFALQYKNSTWVVVLGQSLGDVHGVVFSISQTTTVGQLLASESGLGNGTLKLKKHYFFV